MKIRKKTKKDFLDAYRSEYRRLDEQNGGNHTIEIIMNAARYHQLDFLDFLAHEVGIDFTENGKTALFWLAGEADCKAVELLIAVGSRVNTTVKGTASPLMHAAFNNQIEMAKLLVRHGAEVNYQDANKDSALSFAQKQGHTEIGAFLSSILGTALEAVK
jgi:ankyrin repeat protein